jgi:hypothetical protein
MKLDKGTNVGLCALVLCTHASAQPLRMGYGGSVTAYDITDCDNGDHVLSVGTGAIMRIHPDGSLVWAKTIQTQSAIVGITETFSGELMVALNVNNPDSGYSCPALVRLSSDGSFLSGQYLHFADAPVRAQRFLRNVSRHMLLVRSTAIDQPMAALVGFSNAGDIDWAIAPANTDANNRFNEMSAGPNLGALLYDHDNFTGVITAVNVLGDQLWARSYGIGAQAGGVIYDAALMGNQIVFLARGASTEEPWGSFLLMRANMNGDRMVSLNYGSSDELLMRLNSSDSLLWIKRNGNDVPQFGGTVQYVNGGNTFTHVVNVNEYPGVRYFRSDASSQVGECYDDFSLTVMHPPVINSNVLDFPLIPTPVSTTSYTPIIEDVLVTEVLPCISQGVVVPPASKGPSLWPVPADDHIRIAGMVPGGRLVVRDALGRSVRSLAVTGLEQTFSVADLPVGSYLVDVPTAQGSVRLRFVK